VEIAKAYYPSPLGTLVISATALGIRSISFNKEVRTRSVPPPLEDCVRQLEEYFEGKRPDFNLTLDWSGAGEFDQRVWSYLRKIPYGHTVSYSDVAHALDAPKAVRAVGGANARNPIPIVVPCHRVIGKSGSLVGFAYGLDMKAELLRLERPLEFGKQGKLF
jgi:methylated-DNA-[protein]-cysteine S-methyltransferase